MGIQDHATLQALVERHLSAVTFLQDYLQQFDGPCLNVMNTMVASSHGETAKTGEDQFRNMVCSQISKRVRAVHLSSGQVSIEFANAGQIAVLLDDEHYTGPEAIYYYGFANGAWRAIRPGFE